MLEPSLLLTGFLLGWSVAWPPGPINADIARRASSGQLPSALALLAGAASGDAVWALGVALGVGFLVTAPMARVAMGMMSIVLLLVLALSFLRAAWSALRVSPDSRPTPARLSRPGNAFLIGAAMALASPWNVAFWLAAMGRPELAGANPVRLLAVVAAIIAGAIAWGVLWAAANAILHHRLGGTASRAWTIFVDAATACLMLWFAISSAQRLWFEF